MYALIVLSPFAAFAVAVWLFTHPVVGHHLASYAVATEFALIGVLIVIGIAVRGGRDRRN